MTIWFDMDGTLNNFFDVEDWLPKLRAYDPSPYRDAKPRLHFSTLAHMLHKVQASGMRVGVISWCSKCGTPEYDALVEATKRKWLAKHLPSVDFDEIHITAYGVPKHNFAKDGDMLFDDNAEIREDWGEGAYDVDNILGILKEIIKGE